MHTYSDGGRGYVPHPCYRPLGEEVAKGWDAAVGSLPDGPIVLALEGPLVASWTAAVEGLATAWRRRGVSVACQSTAESFLPWPEFQRRTSSPRLAEDRDFDKLPTGTLAELVARLPSIDRTQAEAWIVYGPGAALVPHDVLWYADLPKRYAEAAVVQGAGRNLGQPGGARATTKRLFYIDWPLLDRHRDALAARIDRWIDLREPKQPASLTGRALRSTLAALARRPFRTLPTFNTTPWGGHWAQQVLGQNPASPNTALGYELIAPESGVLLGDERGNVEVPFGLLVACHPDDILGERVTARFGTSFPIRFDYLDTFGGGNLSVHCHPQESYMREVFGWPYTQHETYYILVGDPTNKIFLGLRDGVDVDAFAEAGRRAEQAGEPFDIERYVQTFPAVPHQLFLVPGGTPHGSGEGNVVLEVSATPYLYSLRFYDWLRRDAEGRQRPTHVAHAFSNLDRRRRGARVAEELVAKPWTLRRGTGWYEEQLAMLPEMFYDVRRLVFETDASLPEDTAGRFHVLNVVEGAGVELVGARGARHVLHTYETLLVPAATGSYTLRRLDVERTRVVKALVR